MSILQQIRVDNFYNNRCNSVLISISRRSILFLIEDAISFNYCLSDNNTSKYHNIRITAILIVYFIDTVCLSLRNCYYPRHVLKNTISNSCYE